MYLQMTRTNKYHAQSCTYNGFTYHSRMEAAYAKQLDFRLHAQGRDKIKKWYRQIKVAFYINPRGVVHAFVANENFGGPEDLRQGSLVKLALVFLCNHYVDFLLQYHDDNFEFVEVKGMETDLWKLKRNLLVATLKNMALKFPDSDLKYTVVK